MLFGALNSCSIVFEGSLVIISLFNNWWIFFVTSFRRDNLVWNDNFSFLNKPLSSLFRKNEVCAEWNTPAKRFKFCYISLLNARLYVSTKIRARRNKVAWNETYMSFLIVKKKSYFEAFRRNISLTTNLLFLKSVTYHTRLKYRDSIVYNVSFW